VTGARGPNRKVQQIAAALRDVDPDPACVVVVADSDVDLEGHPLDELVASVSDDARIGAVWAPPIEAAAESGLGDAASRAVLGASLHAFPLLSKIDPEGLVGKLFAMRLATIERIGGMASLEEHLGEDMEIARRLRERGLEVVRASSPARSLATGRSLEATVLRFARWLSVIRAQRPGLLITYPLFFFGSIPFAVAALALGSDGGGLAALVLIVTRGLVALVADRLTDGRRAAARLVRDIVVADLVIAAAWARALATRTFAWRGQALVIGPGGKLVQRGAEA
jgi:ceramide glucosyltransferase